MVQRLEALALHQYIELIKKRVLFEEHEIQIETSKTTVQKILSNFGEVKGLAAVVVSTIYSLNKTVLQWQTMTEVLENALHHFQTIEQKYYSLGKVNTGALKENTVSSEKEAQPEEITLVIQDKFGETELSVSPKRNKYKDVIDLFVPQILEGGDEIVNQIEMMLILLSQNNIKEACALVDSQAKEMLNCNASRTLALKNDMLRTTEELESLTSEIKSIQTIQMTIKKYLDTGPYKTWEEVQVEFLQYLIQQPLLHLFANELSDSLLSCYIDRSLGISSSKRQEMMIEACLHPAITILNANKIPAEILSGLLPKLKNLNTLSVNLKAEGNQICEIYTRVLACILHFCSKLKCLSIAFKFRPYMIRPQCPLDIALAEFLPPTLKSVNFHDERRLFHIRLLDKMGASENFNSLNKLTLNKINCSFALHQGFKNLVSVAVLNTTFTESELFRKIGGQLKELSLTNVASIQIRILAECCPSLDSLSFKYCSFSSSFHTKPVPTFSSLKQIIFIAHSHCVTQESDLCIWCILQNSPEIEKLIVIISAINFMTCFQKLVKTNEMRYFQQFELYKRNKNIFKGLIERDIAVKMINKFPTLNFIGGIEHATSQRILSEIHPDKTFVCIHEETIHLHEPQSESLSLGV